MGPELFSAKRLGARERNVKVKAGAVQESGRYAVANVIWFQYELLVTISCIIENWVACPTANPLETDVPTGGLLRYGHAKKIAAIFTEISNIVDERSTVFRLVSFPEVSHYIESCCEDSSEGPSCSERTLTAIIE